MKTKFMFAMLVASAAFISACSSGADTATLSISLNIPEEYRADSAGTRSAYPGGQVFSGSVAVNIIQINVTGTGIEPITETINPAAATAEIDVPAETPLTITILAGDLNATNGTTTWYFSNVSSKTFQGGQVTYSPMMLGVPYAVTFGQLGLSFYIAGTESINYTFLVEKSSTLTGPYYLGNTAGITSTPEGVGNMYYDLVETNEFEFSSSIRITPSYAGETGITSTY